MALRTHEIIQANPTYQQSYPADYKIDKCDDLNREVANS
jgi:hypothetical protein